MEFGTALWLDKTQILENDHIYIYIMQFCVLNPFHTTQDTIKLFELPTLILSCTGHPVLLYHMKKFFQSSNQRNKHHENGKIVHKVPELNLFVSIHVPCCAFFYIKKTDIGANKMNPQYRVLSCLSG